MKSVLRLEKVTKKFEGLVAVNELSIDMKARTIHALIGPNGSGKSTTINMITGTFPNTSGKIYHGEIDITNRPAHEVAHTGISRTFQNLKLYTSMTVKENLMVGFNEMLKQSFFSFLFDVKRAREEERLVNEKADEMLSFLGMYHLRDENVKNLSYGRQKMTELGRALMLQPKLLFLDEPAAGLNPSERVEFVDILGKVFESGVDLFLIEHNMDVIMNISHIITVINFGSKIAEGTPREIQNNQEVIKAYLGNRYAASAKG